MFGPTSTILYESAALIVNVERNSRYGV